MWLEDTKKLLLRDYDPFLSLVRPHGQDTGDLDEEFLALKKSFEDQKRSGAITTDHPKKRELITLTGNQNLPHLVTSTTIGDGCYKYRLANFVRLPQKVNDPVIVRWLDADFERDEDTSVPRGLMYDAYLEFCRVNKHCVSNQACFGKSVRNAFPNLQTRRIGERGNSKYHYFGIRPKPGTETANFFSRKQTKVKKTVRSLKKHVKLENFNNESRKCALPGLQINSEAGADEMLRNIIHILIPDFPTHQTITVPEEVAKEADVLLDCIELYAGDVLRATMQSPEKTGFQEVFAASARFWKSICDNIKNDTVLANLSILELMSECDTKIQGAIRDIILPDLMAYISEEKKDKLQTIFGGTYLKEMITAFESAPKEVKYVKKRVYKSFSKEMLGRLKFIRLLEQVDQSFDNFPMSRILQKAVMKLDVDCIMAKCRFAFAMTKSSFKMTEKQFRQGLSTFEASLNHGFHSRGCLNWVRSQVVHQIELERKRGHNTDGATLTMLCFSYATSMIFAELVRYVPLQLQTGLRCLQVLLVDYVSFAVQNELYPLTC